MYKIENESLKDLEQAFELLNQIETKGLQNHSIITSIASLLQKFRGNMKEIEIKEIEEITKEVEKKVKVSNLPTTKEKEKE